MDGLIHGTISRLLERGVIVELEGGVEGFIPTSKLTTENIRNPAEAFKPGDTVSANFKNKEDAEWKSYLSAHKPNQATLGDVMPKLEGEG